MLKHHEIHQSFIERSDILLMSEATLEFSLSLQNLKEFSKRERESIGCEWQVKNLMNLYSRFSYAEKFSFNLLQRKKNKSPGGLSPHSTAFLSRTLPATATSTSELNLINPSYADQTVKSSANGLTCAYLELEERKWNQLKVCNRGSETKFNNFRCGLKALITRWEWKKKTVKYLL